MYSQYNGSTIMAKCARSLSDVSNDILIIVAERLSFHDLVHLSTVCKSCRRVVVDVVQRRRLNQLPWLVKKDCMYRLNGKLSTNLELYNFGFKQTFPLAKFLWYEEVSEFFVDAIICTSKHGWLLFSKKERACDKLNKSTIFFFYNPYRNEIIQVPPLALDFEFCVELATFSTPPTSPNCVICVIRTELYPSGICIVSTCNLRDKRWSNHTTNVPFKGDVLDMAYMEDGTLNCLFSVDDTKSMKLGTIRFSNSSVALEDWAMMELFASLRLLEPNCSCLVESDGKLLMAILKNIGKKDYWYVYEYDPSRKDLTRIKSLGNRVLFLCSSVIGSSMVVSAMGEATKFANMIFCFDDRFGGYNSYTCRVKQGYWSFHGSYGGKRFDNIWIQPPGIN